MRATPAEHVIRLMSLLHAVVDRHGRAVDARAELFKSAQACMRPVQREAPLA